MICQTTSANSTIATRNSVTPLNQGFAAGARVTISAIARLFP